MWGSVGHCRAYQWVNGRAFGYELIAEVEGAHATDPEYVTRVRQIFRQFVDSNWSRRVVFTHRMKILAGDAEDGMAPRQLVVLPMISRANDGC
jgi:hypothetical protein